MTHIFKLISFLVFYYCVFSNVYAEIYVSGNIVADCEQINKSKILNCSYRQNNPVTEPDLTVLSNGRKIRFDKLIGYPDNPGTTAIYILVDTSDPARKAVISKNKTQIKKLVSAKSATHLVGLANFDKELTVLAAPGSTDEELMSSIDKLEAVGRTTELYRNLIKAIKLLDNIEADRKAIFLFSDGLAEDKAYFHKDVINAANASHIIINSFGFPRSVTQSVSLQTIRRISEETGGIFVEADKNYEIPESITNNPYSNLDNGANIKIDISSVINSANQENISLNFKNGHEDISINIPIKINELVTHTTTKIIEKTIPAPQIPDSTGIKTPVQVIRIPATSPDSAYDKWLWYGIPVALLVLILLTIASFYMLLKRPGTRPSSSGTRFSDQFKPYAYLVMQDESQRRYSITRSTWRIGRSKDNELILNDNSVSRRHSEIHRDKGDLFTIVDLGSLNGVFVNNKKVNKQKLHEGDIIEIGDISLRFTLLSTEYQIEESTVMQNTKIPTIN